MTRTKKKKPGSGAVDPSTPNPKLTKTTKKGKKKAQQVKPAGKVVPQSIPKQAQQVDPQVNVKLKSKSKPATEFSKALHAAFANKRALRFVTHKAVPIAVVNDPGFRAYFFEQIATSPHTASAWTAEVGKLQNVSDKDRCYYVLAVFGTAEEADSALMAIHPATIDYQGLKVQVECNKKPGMPFTDLADLLQPEQAAPPVTTAMMRSVQVDPVPYQYTQDNGPSTFDNVSQDPRQGQIVVEQPSSLAPALGAVHAQPTKFKAPSQTPQDLYPTTTAYNVLASNAQLQATPLPPVAHRESAVVESTNISAREPIPKDVPAAELEDIQELDVTTMWSLSSADHDKLQRRYFGYGNENEEPCCVLCGSRFHAWKYCPEAQCAHCGEDSSHVTLACPNVQKCSKCHTKGHTRDCCLSKLQLTYEDGFSCDICGKDGHSENQCSFVWREFIPEKEGDVRKAPKLNMWCYNCSGSDHWGGDCNNKPRLVAKAPLFDTFSSREAMKYEDPSAPLMSMGMSPKIGLQIKGNATAPIFDIDKAGEFVRAALCYRKMVTPQVNTPPTRQPARQRSARHSIGPPGSRYNSAKASVLQPPQQSHYIPAPLPRKPAATMPSSYDNVPRIPNPNLPRRPASRVGDGYVQYQPQPQQSPPPQWAPPVSGRRRTRSPQPRPSAHRIRDDVNAGIYTEYASHGYYDRGSTNPHVSTSDGRMAPGGYHAVPPAPPPPQASAPINYRQVPPPPPPPPPPPIKQHRTSRHRKGAQPPPPPPARPPSMRNYQTYR